MAAVGAITVISDGSSASRSATAFSGRAADWVDRSVPAGTRVPVVWEQGNEGRPLRVDFWLMVTEFFNRSVGDVYRIGEPTYYEVFLPTVPVTSRPDGSIVDRRRGRMESPYVLATCLAPVEGKVLARSPRGSLRVVATNGPVRLSAARRCEPDTP
jgi:hypothetical protein